MPYDIYYYLGKSNHACYRFQRAIIAYENFKSAAKPSESEKLNIDHEISLCINGKKFVSNTKPLEAVEKKSLKQEIVYMAFNDLKSGSKILFTPEDLKSGLDKKKNFQSTLFLSADKNTIYYSSYGDSGLNGKDIYKLTKLGNGNWSLPENIIAVNTSFDEEFPFLSSNGKTLYFSSKGHNSMGGYDIFKCTWNESALIWSQPVNLGIPVNSPSNDIYYTE
ncbi:MAG: PD40 domain-containing protein [Bacteroidetes bacterium]|nr:PD40 domain-containing protein [Bacteroidota bacterium]